jgi:hypothetical protein
LRRCPVVIIVAIGLAVLAPTAAVPAGEDAVISWVAPTPPEGAVIGVAAQTQLSIRLAASAPGGPAVHIKIRTNGAVPRGSSLEPTDGNPATATFTWTPAANQVGDHRVSFAATADVPMADAQRTIVVRVGSPGGRRPRVASRGACC